MATPKSGYWIDGVRVPGVTTVLGKFKDPGGLLWWANRLAYEPLMVGRSLLERAQSSILQGVFDHDLDRQIAEFLAIPTDTFDHNATRDRAANSGTMAHDAAEAYIRGWDFKFEGEKDVVEKAKVSYSAFLEWVDQSNLQITHTEASLISLEHRFGGTMDGATFNGKRGVLDYKTSNSIHWEYLCQVAAYGKLWDENHPDDKVTGGYHILRFDRENGDFHHHYFGELDEAWEAFVMFRKLYDLEKILKKRAK